MDAVAQLDFDLLLPLDDLDGSLGAFELIHFFVEPLLVLHCLAEFGLYALDCVLVGLVLLVGGQEDLEATLLGRASGPAP